MATAQKALGLPDRPKHTRPWPTSALRAIAFEEVLGEQLEGPPPDPIKDGEIDEQSGKEEGEHEEDYDDEEQWDEW